MQWSAIVWQTGAAAPASLKQKTANLLDRELQGQTGAAAPASLKQVRHRGPAALRQGRQTGAAAPASLKHLEFRRRAGKRGGANRRSCAGLIEASSRAPAPTSATAGQTGAAAPASLKQTP